MLLGDPFELLLAFAQLPAQVFFYLTNLGENNFLRTVWFLLRLDLVLKRDRIELVWLFPFNFVWLPVKLVQSSFCTIVDHLLTLALHLICNWLFIWWLWNTACLVGRGLSFLVFLNFFENCYLLGWFCFLVVFLRFVIFWLLQCVVNVWEAQL